MNLGLTNLEAAFPGIETGQAADAIGCARVGLDQLQAVALFVRDTLGYGCFRDLTAIDDPDRDLRFELTYLFYSMEQGSWLKVKARTAEKAPSLVEIFAGANWYEREVYDLFGVIFEGHPDLTRLLLPDDWQGHPLRRDAPIGGEPIDFTVTREIYGT